MSSTTSCQLTEGELATRAAPRFLPARLPRASSDNRQVYFTESASGTVLRADVPVAGRKLPQEQR